MAPRIAACWLLEMAVGITQNRYRSRRNRHRVNVRSERWWRKARWHGRSDSDVLRRRKHVSSRTYAQQFRKTYSRCRYPSAWVHPWHPTIRSVLLAELLLRRILCRSTSWDSLAPTRPQPFISSVRTPLLSTSLAFHRCCPCMSIDAVSSQARSFSFYRSRKSPHT